MRVEERAAALIALVESDRATRTQDIVGPAEREARDELARARREARARVATAIAEERAAFAARVGAAEARLATARRMVRQRRLTALAAEGWEQLPRALAARWAEPPSRHQWIEAALARAVAVLPADEWRIEAPASWSEAERVETLARLAERGVVCDCEVRGDLRAGLRITSRNVELDATPAGLTSERAAVEGRMLHHFASGETA